MSFHVDTRWGAVLRKQAAKLAELDATVGVADVTHVDSALPHLAVTTCTMGHYRLWPSGVLTEALPPITVEDLTPEQRAALDALCLEHGGSLGVTYLRTAGDGVLMCVDGADGARLTVRESGEVFGQ